MEQIKMPEVQLHTVETTSAACVNCEARAAMTGYSTNLCSECRTLFIKYPIPLWIKLFAGGVCLVILFSLFTFPDNLSAAIHLARGKKAADNNKFITARKELEKVVTKYPQHVEARGYLMLSAFYNEDYDAFIKYTKELADTDIDNNKLLAKLVDAQETYAAYSAVDSIDLLQKSYESVGQAAPDSVLAQFVAKHPYDVCALMSYAFILHKAERFAACDSILVQLLEKDDTHIPALQMMANTKRRLGDYNSAIKYCERVLEINKESAYTYAIMARIYLQQRRDIEGLEMAAKGIHIDDKTPYVRATLALAFHFTHQFERRDELVKEAKTLKDPAMISAFGYVSDVINNKVQFR
jgi:tetratricopeptide (TPR) repeat protein